MCDLEAIGAQSIFKLINKAAALTRMLPTLALSCEEERRTEEVEESTGRLRKLNS